MTVRIAVAGAGLVGRRHAAAVAAAHGAALAAVVDPADVGAEIATAHGVPHFRSLTELIGRKLADGVILATPNQLHVENALECIGAGLPALVEKPLASTLEGAERIVAAGRAAGIPLLTGHHRRHNPLIARARGVIAEGRLGRITAVHSTTWFHKPDDYFDVDWRKRPGAGPVYLNLIHDIDLMRHLCGEIVSVHSQESNSVRGNAVEDTAVVLLRFASGALGTVSVSDTIAAPWSWELTSGENPAYPVTSESSCLIGGTHSSMSLPDLAIWSHRGKRSWWEPIDAIRLAVDLADPLVVQAGQFAAVIRGDEPPLVSAEEGLRNQRVIEAVKASAATATTITI